MLAGLALVPACRREAREPFLTYFIEDHGLTIRFPASWKTEQAEQAGVYYRYFLGPPVGPQRKPAVSVTLFVGPLNMPLETYAAQSYLAGNVVTSLKTDNRFGLSGQSYALRSAKSGTRSMLLLFQDQRRVVGLYSQGETLEFERHLPAVEEIHRSLSFERAAAYPVVRNERFGFSLQLPTVWRETRSLSHGEALFLQYTSPPFGVEQRNHTVHATLTLNVEALPPQLDLKGFYNKTRTKLGDSYKVISHVEHPDSFGDLEQVETSITASRIKRYYRVGGGRGYVLACEARDDISTRALPWCDLIATTLRVAIK
jgi:hypothetical protein